MRSRTLTRPMFRMGGSSGTGITSGLDRPGYRQGTDPTKLMPQLGSLPPEAPKKPTGLGLGTIPGFLTQFGLNLASQAPTGNIFSTAAAAAKEPFETFQQAQGARQQDIAKRFVLGQAQFQTGLASLVPGLQRADVGQLGALGAIDRSLDQAQRDAQRQAAQQAAFLPQQQLDRFAGQVTGLMGGYPGGTRQEFIPQPTPLQSALGIATTLGGLYLGSR